MVKSQKVRKSALVSELFCVVDFNFSEGTWLFNFCKKPSKVSGVVLDPIMVYGL